MKFKTAAIAMAVAGSVAAPVAVQAGANEIYASARVGISNQEEYDDENQWSVQSFSSRFGARGETDLGNGLAAFGQYEWDVDDDDFRTRHRYVGLQGDFGRITIGQTYHTFFNFIVAPVDSPWWNSGAAMIEYRGRTDKGISYAGSADNFAVGITAYFEPDSEEELIDQAEVAASYTFDNDVVLAVGGIATQADFDAGTGRPVGDSDHSLYGVTLSGIELFDYYLSFNVEFQDENTSYVADFYGIYGTGFYLHLERHIVSEETQFNPTGEDLDRKHYTLGYTQPLGRKTTMWYEVSHGDEGSHGSWTDYNEVMAVLKYDII
jgi:predicted porin